jgi:hypothetical protein
LREEEGAGINCHLPPPKDGRRARGRWAGAAEPRSTPRSRGREAGGKGSADRWGRHVSVCEEKKKKKGEAGCCGRGIGGLVGRWAEKEGEVLFFFSFSFFKLF